LKERAKRFVMVGVTCTLLQIILQQLLESLASPGVANIIAFELSAQLNFTLSYRFTWSDSDRQTTHGLLRLWLKFNTLAVLAATVNTSVFVSIRGFLPGLDAISIVLAGGVSTTTVFLISRYYLFKASTHPPINHVTDKEGAFVAAKPGSVAFFLPAHDEAENLPYVIGEAASFLHELGGQSCIIVVDDGSTDGTVGVVATSALGYPSGLIQCVQHPRNLGYGAALRTGFKAALATDMEWIAFCDADGQFSPHEVGEMLEVAEHSGADIVVGYRIKRADGWQRLMLGKAWHILSQLVLSRHAKGGGGFSPKDVDCGFKLFRRSALAALMPDLIGDHAAISPEIFARGNAQGMKFAQVGVTHKPRKHGEQSGANLRVALGSVRQLRAVRADIDN